MSHAHEKPEKHGAHAPQVAVRDGNRLVCPCCGEVLITLVDQAPETPQQAPPNEPPQEPDLSQFKKLLRHKGPVTADNLAEPIDQEVAGYEFPEEAPPKLAPFKKPRSKQAPSEQRSKPRKRRAPLREAKTFETARFYAWLYYRLKQRNRKLIEKINKNRTVIAEVQKYIDQRYPVAPKQEASPAPQPPRERVIKVRFKSPTGKPLTPEERERMRKEVAKRVKEEYGDVPIIFKSQQRGPP